MCSDKTEKNITVDRGIKPGGWSPSTPNANPYGSGGGGFGGGFGGSSRRRAKKRAKARAAAIAGEQAGIAAAAQAAQALAEQEQARIRREQAHVEYIRQVDAFTQIHIAKRLEWDQAYATKSNNLASLLEAQLLAIRKAPSDYKTGNDWGLYLISKKKSETATLISTKNSELQARHVELSTFDGHPPLSRTPADYKQALVGKTINDTTALNHTHRNWEQAYIAAHEAKILSESIRQLTEQSQALSVRYAEREIQARQQAAEAERRRQSQERRAEQIKHHLRVDENQRQELIKSANTFTVPASATSTATVLTRGGVAALEGLTGALESAVADTVAELGRILALRVGQTVALTATSLLYSAELGNGELTPEQRRRLFQGVGVATDALNMPDHEQLRAIADSGGFVDADHRIRPVAVESGTELHVVNTGNAVPP